MIFVRDKGRMANNMLQYAHLYAWAREHGRRTMSMRFAYKYQYFHICHTRHHNFITYVAAKFAARLGLIPTVSFNEPQTDTLLQEKQMLDSRWVVAEGWYARWYDLVLKYKPEILQLFAFDSRVEQAAAQTLSQLPEADLTLGLHIRRGDYRTWQDGRFYFTDEQFIAAAKSFLAHKGGQRVRIVICGNDPTLDTRLYRQQLAPATVDFPCGNAAEDLCLLSQCDYLMGPPSTYSLVATMYHDVPLYWIHDPQKPVSDDCFQHFDQLFRNIL